MGSKSALSSSSSPSRPALSLSSSTRSSSPSGNFYGFQKQKPPAKKVY
jgi:hypothetical protein